MPHAECAETQGRQKKKQKQRGKKTNNSRPDVHRDRRGDGTERIEKEKRRDREGWDKRKGPNMVILLRQGFGGLTMKM